MAEGGKKDVDNSLCQEPKAPVRLAEGEDLQEQENELFALEAIYETEDLEICKHDNASGHPPGGIFNIPIKTPQDFYVKVTKDLHQIKLMAFSAVRGRGWREKINQRAAQRKKENENCESSESPAKPGSQPQPLYLVKRLPPITLNFSFPHDYPSVSPPNFTLSCCWLEKKNLTKLCEKLDEIWTRYAGSPIISVWHDFLYHEVIQFLEIKSPYDLGRVLVHLFTHPPGYEKKNYSFMAPRPFDWRGVQTFGNIDEVLPAVLDFNLTTCDVCMEEKPGHQFLRLVNCTEHRTCKLCTQGWLEAMIKDGAVSDLRCPGYKCEKSILPTEVAAVVSKELYERYEKLLLKTAFDIMPDVMICPRTFCQFPVVIEDNLGLCPNCKHAFCGRCQNTYHGHSPCKLKSEMFALLVNEYESSTAERRQELEMRYGKMVIQRALEETKSNKWLETNSKQCPCCSTFIQKKDGCNKMVCSNCRAFFCWLCQQELSKANPYAHYQHPTSACSNRLFEGVEIHDEILEFLDELDSSEDEDDDDEDEVDVDRL